MFGNNRNQLRQVFFDTWQLKLDGQPLDALQQVIAGVIELHSEYHPLLGSREAMDRDFPVEDGGINPFLHISMHLALHEQISTRRPAGIDEIYRQLCQQFGDAHEAEHAMMDCLGEALWQAQRDQAAPDETAYRQCLKTLINKK